MYNVLKLDDVIEEHINWVLYLTDNNISETAKKLGMHRRSLQRYLSRKKRRKAKSPRRSKKAATRRRK